TFQLVAFITAFFICLYAHMFKLLQAQKAQSRQTLRMIRRSIFALFAQLSVPLLTIAIPIGLLFTSMF
ncbi:hypothetical protein PFISCL1PPCAC_219, partial [Pristionchus fissidentatus]